MGLEVAVLERVARRRYTEDVALQAFAELNRTMLACRFRISSVV